MLTLAGHLAAATCSFLMMVGEYDRRRSWESWECLSCAHWLNWRCGVGMTAAREQVRVARRLQELPLVRATFARGELSYSKVRAITRVAHPAIEAKLVDLARWSTASQLEQACAALRRCTDPAQAEKHLQEEEDRAELRRSLSWSTDPESGDLVVRLRIPAGVAAESFRTSVDALADVRANGRSDGQSDTEQAQPVALECRRLDALDGPRVRRRDLRHLARATGGGRRARDCSRARVTAQHRAPVARRDPAGATAAVVDPGAARLRRRSPIGPRHRARGHRPRGRRCTGCIAAAGSPHVVGSRSASALPQPGAAPGGRVAGPRVLSFPGLRSPASTPRASHRLVGARWPNRSGQPPPVVPEAPPRGASRPVVADRHRHAPRVPST